ncbi:MAG: TonB-dependent receptor plug domain-containing protein, partial [Rhizomicrobium sp.]
MKRKTFLFGSVSALALGLVAMQAGAQTANNATMETVVVTGIRASLEKGLEVKRESTQVVESISAEDIGKFPDNNIVEALQRISGVQVTDRAGGEVSTLSIRGMSDIETTWNGRKVFTSNGRYFSVQDMPATLVSRLDAYKTRGADQIESGIGGVIDVKSHRPFDFDGFKFSTQVRETYQEKAGAFDPNISALISDTWNTRIGKIGVLANVSWSTIHYRDESATPGAMVPFASSDVYTSDGTQVFFAGQRIYSTYSSSPLNKYSPSYVVDDQTVQVNIWQPGLINGLSEAAGATLTANEYTSATSSTTTGNSISIPYVLSRDAVFISDNKGKTTRPNMNAAFQWQPNDKSLYTFEFMYNGYRNSNSNNMLFSYVDWWGAFDTGGDLDGQFLDSITTYEGT